MVTSNSDDLLQFLLSEYRHPFKGWDFSYIKETGRMSQGVTSWSYGSLVLLLIRKAKSLLDLGTGGGELLNSLRPLPKFSYATENYAPNLPIARRRLKPAGVKVIKVESNDRLPFKDGLFDVVIDRHESYSPREVYRILEVGGTFITQQVGEKNGDDLRELLRARKPAGSRWNMNVALKELRKEGFEIGMQREDFPVMRFYDVGALVYYLKAVPWDFPDFGVRKYFPILKNLHDKIQKEGYLEVENHRCIIIAKK